MRRSILFALCLALAADAAGVFRIDIIDVVTGRGVPMVRVKGANVWRYSDSAGIVAWDDLLDTNLTIAFEVLTDGYSLANGSSYVALTPTSGGTGQIMLDRAQPAQRRYRLTGEGIYADSIAVGAQSPIDDPLISSVGVTGQDTLKFASYKGRRYWMFGDTDCTALPTNCGKYLPGWEATAGVFSVGASSSIDETNPPSLEYFERVSEGLRIPAQIAPVAPTSWNGQPCNTWMGALHSFVDLDSGEEMMFAPYVKPCDGINSSTGKQGLMQWNDETMQFEKVASFWSPTDACLPGEQCPMSSISDGPMAVQTIGPDADPDYQYFGFPFATYRVLKKFSAVTNQSAWESYSPLLSGSDMTNPVIDPAGWGWKKNLSSFNAANELKLIQDGLLPSNYSAHYQVEDVDDKSTGCDWVRPFLVLPRPSSRQPCCIIHDATHVAGRRAAFGTRPPRVEQISQQVRLDRKEDPSGVFGRELERRDLVFGE